MRTCSDRRVWQEIDFLLMLREHNLPLLSVYMREKCLSLTHLVEQVAFTQFLFHPPKNPHMFFVVIKERNFHIVDALIHPKKRDFIVSCCSFAYFCRDSRISIFFYLFFHFYRKCFNHRERLLCNIIFFNSKFYLHTHTPAFETSFSSTF